MKPHVFISLFMCMTLAVQLHAQSYKVLKTISDIETGRETVEKGKRTFDTFKGILPKKKNKTDTAKIMAATPENKVTEKTGAGSTSVSISGIDFATLRTFTENIKACAGVQSADMKYNSGTSTIQVLHTGTTAALLKLMEETSGNIFSAKQIENFEEGRISLKLK